MIGGERGRVRRNVGGENELGVKQKRFDILARELTQEREVGEYNWKMIHIQFFFFRYFSREFLLFIKVSRG